MSVSLVFGFEGTALFKRLFCIRIEFLMIMQ